MSVVASPLWFFGLGVAFLFGGPSGWVVSFLLFTFAWIARIGEGDYLQRENESGRKARLDYIKLVKKNGMPEWLERRWQKELEEIDAIESSQKKKQKDRFFAQLIAFTIVISFYFYLLTLK